jgi:outer membrane biosynthesis protein TonB
VRFRIEVDGTVSHVTILQSTRPEFVEPTLRSVRTMRFAPARIGGRPVRVWVEEPITWTVRGRPPRQAEDRTERPMVGRPRR